MLAFVIKRCFGEPLGAAPAISDRSASGLAGPWQPRRKAYAPRPGILHDQAAAVDEASIFTPGPMVDEIEIFFT